MSFLLVALLAAAPASRSYRSDDGCDVTVNANNNLDGPIKCYFPDGKVRYVGRKVDGKAEGEAISWDEEGQLRDVETWHDGKLNGPRQHYEGGAVTAEEHYADGKKQGVQKEFWKKEFGGAPIGIKTYDQGEERGPFERYWKNGKVQERGVNGPHGKEGLFERFREDGSLEESERYAGGKLDGPRRRYFPNGKVQDEESFRAGVRHGLYSAFHENGTLRMQQCYQNDASVTGLAPCLGSGKGKDVVKSFYADGKPSELTTFVDGKRNGLCESYYPNGNLRESATYKSDVMEGPWKQLYESGKPQATATLKAGKPDGTEERFLEDGKIVERLIWKSGACVSRMSFWQNGKPRLEENRAGELVLQKLYYDNGHVDREGPVLPDDGLPFGEPLSPDQTVLGWVPNGTHKSYFEDGMPYAERSFTHGRRDGVARWFFASGRLATEAHYKDDRLLSRKEYDAQGKLLLSEEYNPDGSRK
jgi:uncharacterized protein